MRLGEGGVELQELDDAEACDVQDLHAYAKSTFSDLEVTGEW